MNQPAVQIQKYSGKSCAPGTCIFFLYQVVDIKESINPNFENYEKLLPLYP
jgi:hypothetical protein